MFLTVIFFAFISSFHSSNIWNSYIHHNIFIFPGYLMNQFNDRLLAGLLSHLSCAYDRDAHSIKCIYTTYKTDRNYWQWVLTLLQQMDSEHEYENLVPWVPLWGSGRMYVWSSPKYSSARTNKNAFWYQATSKWTEVSDLFAYLNPQQYMSLVKCSLGIHEKGHWRVMFLGCRTFHNQVLVQWGIC